MSQPEVAGPDRFAEMEAIRKTLEAEGFVPTWWDAPPGTIYPGTVHARDEVLWIVSGRARVAIGAGQRELGPGDRVDIPAGVRHGLEVLGGEVLVFYAALQSRISDRALTFR
ncbi:MAG: cupin domain-containing protein [Planctomycetes bacterium]|nr:cupin domain-containing protein [Planctomycetota bacterium]